MKLSNLISRASGTIAIVAVVAVLGACSDSFIYDYEGDCDPKYRVHFVYDYNMNGADAFPVEVDHVTLNVIDTEGRIVYTHRESGEALADKNYEIVLDDKVAPGKYRLQAWCGSGAEPGNSSFAVHPAEKLEDLRCTLLPDPESRADIAGAEGTHLARPLQNLYHAYSPIKYPKLKKPGQAVQTKDFVVFPEGEGIHHVDTLELIKNTNAVNVVLQHLSGQPLDFKEFDFTITAANARMNYDNTIIEAEPVTYHPWDIRGGYADINPDDAHTGGVFSTVIGEFTTARLMADERVMLSAIRKTDGKVLFSVPLIDMALLVKSANIASMPDQEFLDRQDSFNFIFFLDSNLRWTQVQININSWKVVYNNKEI